MIIKLIMLFLGILSGVFGLFIAWLVEEAFTVELMILFQSLLVVMIVICVKSFKKNLKLYRSPDYEQYKIERERIKQEKQNLRNEKRRIKIMNSINCSYSKDNKISIAKVLLIVGASIVYLFFGPIVLLTSQYMKKK